MIEPQDLPSFFQMRSAGEVARLLAGGDDRVTRETVEQSYYGLPATLPFGPDDLLRGQEILIRAGVLRLDGDALVVTVSARDLARLQDDVMVTALAMRLLERRPPAWLRGAAAGHEVRMALVPDPAREMLPQLLGQGERLQAGLRAAARHAERRLRSDHERAGLQVVLEGCRAQLTESGHAELADEVAVAGQFSELLGYDVIAGRPGAPATRLAVHTARRVGWGAEVRLSRTEYETGLADDGWALVVCTSAGEDQPLLHGWCRAGGLVPLVPHDQHAHGRWSSVSLRLAPESMNAGLPPV